MLGKEIGVTKGEVPHSKSYIPYDSREENTFTLIMSKKYIVIRGNYDLILLSKVYPDS